MDWSSWRFLALRDELTTKLLFDGQSLSLYAFYHTFAPSSYLEEHPKVTAMIKTMEDTPCDKGRYALHLGGKDGVYLSGQLLPIVVAYDSYLRSYKAHEAQCLMNAEREAHHVSDNNINHGARG